MAKKEFTFHGKSLEDLQQMADEEFAQYVDARTRRSILKGFSEPQKRFLAKLDKKQDNIKTHCRDMIVLPRMVGKTILIHTGKEFAKLVIAPEMVGHFLGEYAFTRKRVAHSSPGVGATKSSSNVSVK